MRGRSSSPTAQVGRFSTTFPNYSRHCDLLGKPLQVGLPETPRCAVEAAKKDRKLRRKRKEEEALKELEKVFKVALPSRVVSDKHRDMGTNQPVGRLFVDERYESRRMNRKGQTPSAPRRAERSASTSPTLPPSPSTEPSPAPPAPQKQDTSSGDAGEWHPLTMLQGMKAREDCRPDEDEIPSSVPPNMSAYGRAHEVQVRASSRGQRSTLTQQSLTKKRLKEGWSLDTLPEQQRSLVEKQGKWRGSKEVEEEWQAKQLQKGANNKRSGKGSVLKRHVSGVGGNGQRSDSLAMSSHLDYGRQARPIDPRLLETSSPTAASTKPGRQRSASQHGERPLGGSSHPHMRILPPKNNRPSSAVPSRRNAAKGGTSASASLTPSEGGGGGGAASSASLRAAHASRDYGSRPGSAVVGSQILQRHSRSHSHSLSNTPRLLASVGNADSDSEASSPRNPLSEFLAQATEESTTSKSRRHRRAQELKEQAAFSRVGSAEDHLHPENSNTGGSSSSSHPHQRTATSSGFRTTFKTVRPSDWTASLGMHVDKTSVHITPDYRRMHT